MPQSKDFSKVRVLFHNEAQQRITIAGIPYFYAASWQQSNCGFWQKSTLLQLFSGYKLNCDKCAGYFNLATLDRDWFSNDSASWLRAIGLVQEANWLAAKVSSQSLANRSPILCDSESLTDRHFIREGAFA